jgi:glycogen(starch) synthase
MPPKKVAMLVSNPCNPDYRVVKQAECLAHAGYEVRVFCVWEQDLGAPEFEQINSVTYVRREWKPQKALEVHYFGAQNCEVGVPGIHGRKRRGAARIGKPALPLPSLLVRCLRKPISQVLFNCFSIKRYRSYEIVFVSLVQEWAPDIIHSHDGVTLPAAAKSARHLGARLVFDSHELEAHRNPPLTWSQRKQVERMERAYLVRADRVITVSQCISDYLAAKYRIRRPEVIFNTPEASQKTMQPRWGGIDRSDVRSELKLDLHKFLFVYTGRVTFNRGLELAIKALSKLQGFQDPNKCFDSDYHLAVVGAVQKGYDGHLQQLAAACGVSQQVHFLPPVAPQQVASYIEAANASIIPIMPVTLSYNFAMPNKLFEAMLAGLPIIGSDLIEMGTFIRNNGLGLTYTSDKINDCVSTMKTLITHFARFHRSLDRQHELAKTYSWEAQTPILLSLYNYLTTSKP